MNYFKTTLILLLLFLAGKNYCQHTIKLYSGDTLYVKVIEITEKKTTYKLANYFDGPAIVISNSKIDQIVYPNGEVITFEDDSPLGKESFYNKKNSLEIVISEVTVGRLGFGYNRHIGRWFNVRLNGSFTISQNQLFDRSFNIKNFLSIDGQYFPLGHKRIAFFTGIRSLVGQHYYFATTYSIINGLSRYTTSEHLQNFGAVQMQNGIQINIGQNLNINALWATGLLFIPSNESHAILNQGAVSLGFKF